MSWHFNDDEMDNLATEGPHEGRISSAALTKSTNGEAMVKIKITNSAGQLLAWDNIMLEGRGLNIGVKKLSVLGIANRSRDGQGWDIPDVERWTGCPPFIVHLKHEEFRNKVSAKVDFDAPGFGYEELAAASHRDPVETLPDPNPIEDDGDDDDIPF